MLADLPKKRCYYQSPLISLSDYVGQAEMVAPNKIKAIALGYVVASGDPPTVKAIHVLTIDAHFTDPDTLEWTGVGNIYAPSADGFPHADLLLVGPFPPVLYLFKRVKP